MTTEEINADTLTGFPRAKRFDISWLTPDAPVVCITDTAGRVMQFELTREHVVVAVKKATDYVIR